MQLLQKIQTLTDAPFIKSRGVKTFERNGDVYFLLILPKTHILV